MRLVLPHNQDLLEVLGILELRSIRVHHLYRVLQALQESQWREKWVLQVQEVLLVH